MFSAPTKNESTARARSELITALSDAVQAELRFGSRADCKTDLKLRWDIAIDALERLMKKK